MGGRLAQQQEGEDAGQDHIQQRPERGGQTDQPGHPSRPSLIDLVGDGRAVRGTLQVGDHRHPAPQQHHLPDLGRVGHDDQRECGEQRAGKDPGATTAQTGAGAVRDPAGDGAEHDRDQTPRTDDDPERGRRPVARDGVEVKGEQQLDGSGQCDVDAELGQHDGRDEPGAAGVFTSSRGASTGGGARDSVGMMRPCSWVAAERVRSVFGEVRWCLWRVASRQRPIGPRGGVGPPARKQARLFQSLQRWCVTLRSACCTAVAMACRPWVLGCEPAAGVVATSGSIQRSLAGLPSASCSMHRSQVRRRPQRVRNLEGSPPRTRGAKDQLPRQPSNRVGR